MSLIKNFMPAGVCFLAGVFLLVFPATIYVVAVLLLVSGVIMMIRGAQRAQQQLEDAQSKVSKLTPNPEPRPTANTPLDSSSSVRKLNGRR